MKLGGAMTAGVGRWAVGDGRTRAKFKLLARRARSRHDLFPAFSGDAAGMHPGHTPPGIQMPKPVAALLGPAALLLLSACADNVAPHPRLVAAPGAAADVNAAD